MESEQVEHVDDRGPVVDDPPRPRRPRWVRVLTIGALVLVSLASVTVITLSLIPMHKVAFRPGSASPAVERLAVDGAQTYDAEGSILFLTVTVDRLSVLEWLFVRGDHDSFILPEKVAFPKGHKEDQQENAVLMTRAKSNAELVALEYLGYDAFTPTGAMVVALANGPAAAVIKPGETIVAVNDRPVTSRASLLTRMSGTKPGDTVTLRIEDREQRARVETITLAANPNDASRGFLGVQTETRVSEKNPAPISLTIDSGRIGGDSAGLAFTLTIIDDLTPGELTGGKRVAITGTINVDGDVGEIGGIEQKVVAAERAKADIMIVPVANFEAAKAKAAGKLDVVAVANIDEALKVLAGLGGNTNDLPAHASN